MSKLTSHLNQSIRGVERLRSFLPGNISSYENINSLNLDRNVGSGYIQHIVLQSGLEVYDFNIKLNQNINIHLNAITEGELHFLYCLEGSLYHQFESNDTINFINQFQTSVLKNSTEYLSQLIIKKNCMLRLNMISIDRNINIDRNIQLDHIKDNEKYFGTKLVNLITEIKKQSLFFHSGNYNLKIANQLNLIHNTKSPNKLSELLLHKGRYYLVLSKHIEQFYEEIENRSNTSGLLKKDLKKIAELGDYIKKNPETQHSIKSLCAMSGLSPSKLQEGFKFMHSRTVSDFVRNTRLEKAERLLTSTDLTISEIVYSVGLTSRSYFCKIFKDKYKFSPREYKQSLSNINI